MQLELFKFNCSSGPLSTSREVFSCQLSIRQSFTC